ncbi:hypothetical protein B0H63DRAFT_310587 [Podospora didyma]|uniref:Uncharacterized protein n=1 Tax=Podospora didyma TaxID=330526 RepID=A0AAE0K5U1_9PEZI|nr:hypothetical protein B0H63DRAFT_310587 [Podospora didyma]
MFGCYSFESIGTLAENAAPAAAAPEPVSAAPNHNDGDGHVAPEGGDMDTWPRPELIQPLQPNPPVISKTPTLVGLDMPSPPTVDNLVHKLSRQNLRFDSLGLPLPQSSPAISDKPDDPDILPTIQPWTGLEVDDELPVRPSTPTHRLSDTIPPLTLLDHGSPIEVDELAGPSPDIRPTNWQATKELYSNSVSARVNARLASMISTGTQCNVRSAPQPGPTLPTRLTTSSVVEERIPSWDLEVDEAYANGTADVDEEERVFTESIMSLRRAAGPGGIRKNMVAGIPLRYRLSTEAALRCPNVVRSRPRMRRRDKDSRSRRDSVASSGITSAMSSPIIPPSIPSPRFPPHP